MVWDSRKGEVATRHKGLVQLLKEKRAEGHFAGLPLDQRINVYDAALPAHAASLKLLGLSSQGLPMLCLTEIDTRGIPRKVLWKTTYGGADAAMAALDGKLGIRERNLPKVPPHLFLVGPGDHPAVREMTAKIDSLLPAGWKNAPLAGGLQRLDTLAEVPVPGVALVDPESQKLLWKKSLEAPDVALQTLGQRLGVTYVPPDALRWSDGSQLVRVSGGKVPIGTNQGPEDCQPLHIVDLSPYYYVGKTEVTVSQFERFVQATNYQTDAERAGRSFIWTGKQFASVLNADWRHPQGSGSSARADFPVVHITFNDASAYCNWAGLRLPSEAEWERAAGGKLFPWGADWVDDRCRSSVGKELGSTKGPVAVGSYPQGASPWGCLDLAGNVYEWTSSLYMPYTPQSARNPRMNGLRRVIRGGSFGNEEKKDFITYIRTAVGAQDATEAQGFRVCLDGTRGVHP